MLNANIATHLSWSSTEGTRSVELPLKCCVRQFGERIGRVIVALHGFGDNAQNFTFIADELNLKDTLWVALQAPEHLPFPGDGGQWYELFGNPHPQLNTSCTKVKRSLELIHEHLGLDWNKIILFGFSQGAFVSMLCGLESTFQVGGILALSGYLARAHRLPVPAATRQQLPIFVAHGMNDQVVFPAQHFETLDILQHFGFCRITSKTYPGLAHSIGAEEIFDIRKFIEGLP